MTWVHKLSDHANQGVEWCVAGLAAFFTLLLIVSVFSRYVFDVSIVEGVELTRVAFLWAVFLAASAAAKKRAHVRIIVLAKRMPEHIAIALIRIADLCIGGFGVAMVWFGYQMSERVAPTFLPTLQISQAWLYGALPVCGALIILHALSHLFEPVNPEDLFFEVRS